MYGYDGVWGPFDGYDWTLAIFKGKKVKNDKIEVARVNKVKVMPK